MKTPFLFLLSILGIGANAQITYNGTTMAGLGDTVFLAEDTSHASSLDIGDATGDQVWDFTSVMEEKPDGAILEQPSTAPLFNLFPDADFVANDIYEDSVHLFFKKTATALDIVGIVEYDSNGNPTPGELSGTWRFMQFPAQFETTFSSVVLRDTSTFELGVDFDSIGPHPFIDSIRTAFKFSFYNEIDAWGEVQLPQGSFDAIRQKTYSVLETKSDCYYDSAWHEFTPLMLLFLDDVQYDTTTDAIYRWWTADEKVNLYVCQIETDTNGMPESSFSYTKETPTEPAGITSTKVRRVTVYPNPSSEVLNVKFSVPTVAVATLYDVNARAVLFQELGGSDTEIQISELPVGVYMLQLTDQSGKLIGLKKVQVSR